MPYKIFVINPGSTSTKLAYFEDEHKLFETSVFHDAPELQKFSTINAQLPYRKGLILNFIEENKIDLSDVDAIVGRGGGSYPCKSGVYEITDKLLADTIDAKSGVQHPSNLGPQLAKELQNIYGGRIFIVDSPMTDEFDDIARITGIQGLYRHSHLHVLNLKGTIREHCRRQEITYEDHNFIVCHIDGGMSVTAHKKGRIIDGTDAAGGEGPFTPTRTGTINSLDLMDYIATSKDNLKTIRKMAATGGGLSSYFGTSNADTIHALVEAGDKKAGLIWNSMIYQICKHIGSMASVLEGQVDGIVCGGGLMRFSDIGEGISRRCGWIAPFSIYPGEFEHEAMAAGAIRVLKGQEALQIYTGEKPWSLEESEYIN